MIVTLTSKSESETPSAGAPTVVRVRHASKRFVIRKDKSFKERIVNFGRGRKHRDEFWALRDVDLEIPLGSTVGLIGANGSGKSTLLKLIGGIVQPTTGTVERRGRLAALLELGAGFHPDLTGRENVYLNGAILGLSRTELDGKFDSIVEFSEIAEFIDTQVKFYSSGMYVRLAFAIAIHTDPDLLLVDEVLAVGDEPFQRKCMDRIRAFQRAGKTIILVTHSLEQVGELCDRTIVLEKGNVVFDGETSEGLQVLRESFEDRRAARQEREAAAADSDAEPAPQLIEILGCELRGGSIEHGGTVVRSGETLEFDVTVRTSRPVADWNIGMGIDTPLGQRVFGTNTERIGTALRPVHGEMTVTFTLPDLHLGGGNYAVHASAATFSQGETMRIPVAATFTVERSSVHDGVVDIDSTVRLTTP
ncbi:MULTISPECIES: ABC transporter ATP-binding protein [unclassified Rathayibacter]|uniref:ABC transporter ATP-binding protein n=1 Tax=unclassified Rathayibacter TaxID=2609250 RepID=UPI00188C228F|nr:ABC transporter ATP-binding protein [Rathayibacter sp. VKM Ac-2879]MBF4504933.1 ABC transporter ATP-binding protein [Rathayibacter sp. VKM Ac-2878]